MRDENFIKLIESIEFLEGEQLPELCTPEYYEIEVPKAKGKTKKEVVATTGCNNESMFSLPYDRVELAKTRERPQVRDGKHVRGGLIPDGIEIIDGVAFAKEVGVPERGIVTACAVDDLMDRWPRIQQEMDS